MEKILLEKFFLNNCNIDERRYVIQWMLNADNDVLLKNWMKEHWDLLSFYNTGEEPDIDKIWSNLQQSIKEEYSPTVSVITLHSPSNRVGLIKKLMIAASVAAMFFFIINIFFLHKSIINKENDIAANSIVKEGLIQKRNDGATPLLIKLEDGSKVTLQPSSELNYTAKFPTNKREVFLKGEAFFEVSKKKDQPFYVYTESLTTKVLGTSFTIKATASSRNIEVSVRTGRVWVYDKDRPDEKISTHSIILTPNQKTIFSKEKKEFQISLVDVPLPINDVYPDSTLGSNTDIFDFKEVKIKDAIARIKKYYGIEVLVEQDRLNECVFKGNVSDLNLYEKLDAICEAVNASYIVAGTKILIKGSGCK